MSMSCCPSVLCRDLPLPRKQCSSKDFLRTLPVLWKEVSQSKPLADHSCYPFVALQVLIGVRKNCPQPLSGDLLSEVNGGSWCRCSSAESWLLSLQGGLHIILSKAQDHPQRGGRNIVKGKLWDAVFSAGHDSCTHDLIEVMVASMKSETVNTQ